MATSEPAEVARLLSKKELARLLGVSARSVDRLRADGRLPAPVRVGALPRWRQVDVQEWIASQAGKVGG